VSSVKWLAYERAEAVGRRTRVSYSPVPHQRGSDLGSGVFAGP
jgi:hypothetical protein